MSKWKITSKYVRNYGVEITAKRIEPFPHVTRKLTRLGSGKPPTPAQLERDIKDWLAREEERLPVDADNEYAAAQLNGKVLEVIPNEQDRDAHNKA